MADPVKDLPAIAKLFEDLGALVADIIAIAKKKDYFGILKLIPDVMALIQDAVGAIPEFASLDQAEAQLIGGAAYDCVKKIIEAAAA